VGWKGSWSADKTVFTGTYTHPDKSEFVGTFTWTDKHVLVHSWPGMGEKRVEMPVEPHWEIVQESGSGAIPPPPERK
jgi:hypothetical protein